MHVYNGIRLGNEKRDELLIHPTGTRLKCIILSKEARFKKGHAGTSLVAQWFRICLPMQGTLNAVMKTQHSQKKKKKKSDMLFESIYVTMFLKKQNDATENRTGVA